VPRTPTDPMTAPAAPTLAVVIVNFNSWSDTSRLVRGLAGEAAVASGHCEVVVVDNASDGPIPPELANPAANVRLIPRARNGGFAAGVNAGWRASSSRWLLLLNPDVVAGPGLIGRILGRIEELEGRPGGAPGIVGFGLRNADGSRQPSVGAAPGLARSLREPLIPRTRRKYQAAWRTKAGPVPWVTGACALVDARLLRDLGGMDDDFFLYYEEVALCQSARSLGRAVEYDPTVEVVHLHPLQNRAVTPKMRVITRHSKLLYFRKHRPAWEFRSLSVLVAVEAAVRGAWASLRGEAAAARAWRAVGGLSRTVRAGTAPRGRAVLELAVAAVAAPPTGAARAKGKVGPKATPGRRRPQLRKDGTR